VRVVSVRTFQPLDYSAVAVSAAGSSEPPWIGELKIANIATPNTMTATMRMIAVVIFVVAVVVCWFMYKSVALESKIRKWCFIDGQGWVCRFLSLMRESDCKENQARSSPRSGIPQSLEVKIRSGKTRREHPRGSNRSRAEEFLYFCCYLYQALTI
jgi:hypothetical protein